MSDGLRTRRLVVGVLSWVVFTLGWWVAVRPGVAGAAAGAAVLLLSALAALAVTLWWQRHNRSVYRRRGARRGTRPELPAWAQDRSGRPLHFEAGVETASEVVIGLRADAKTYRSAS